MLLYWRKGQLEFTTDVEDWMADQSFTEVFRYGGTLSEEEKEITRELDRMLFAVRYGKKGIEETLDSLARYGCATRKGQIMPPDGPPSSRQTGGCGDSTGAQ
jgi:hypothetical protein